MNARIKQIREVLGMSQKDFAESINLQRNSISLIELGKRNPGDRTIMDICEKYSVNEEWLRTGSGDVFSSKQSEPLAALVAEYNLSNADAILVERFLKLNKAQRDAVTDFVHQIALAFNAMEPEDVTTEAAEAAYRQALGIAPPEGSTASSTTPGTGAEDDAVADEGG